MLMLRYLTCMSLQDFEDVRQLKSLIQRHLKFTGSQVARQILLNWDKERTKFVKVRPSMSAA